MNTNRPIFFCLFATRSTIIIYTLKQLKAANNLPFAIYVLFLTHLLNDIIRLCNIFCLDYKIRAFYAKHVQFLRLIPFGFSPGNYIHVGPTHNSMLFATPQQPYSHIKLSMVLRHFMYLHVGETCSAVITLTKHVIFHTSHISKHDTKYPNSPSRGRHPILFNLRISCKFLGQAQETQGASRISETQS